MSYKNFPFFASSLLFLDLLAESSMNLKKPIDLDRGLVSNFSEFHSWDSKDGAFGFDDLGQLFFVTPGSTATFDRKIRARYKIFHS